MNVVITGCNRGIGLMLAKTYKDLGEQVFGLCRETSSELNKLGINIIEGVNVIDPNIDSILKEKLKDIKIDLLINNAGVLRSQSLENFSNEDALIQFQVNSLAPINVTKALIDNFNKPAKVAIITSRMGSIADNSSGGSYGYRMSKAAVNAAGKSLAIDLKGQEIAVGLIHPGWVQTDMTGKTGDITPDVSAERISKRIAELNFNNTGGFWHSNGEVLPW